MRREPGAGRVRLVVVAGALVALGAVAVLLVVANLNAIVAANRDRIVAGMSAGFARPVVVERLAVGFHGGLAMEIDGLRIADDPAFSTDDFLAAEKTYAVVRFWPLLRRRIDVRRITVRSPRVTLIRTAHGMNVDTLGRRPGNGPAAATTGADGGGPAAAPAFLIALLNLEGGTVRYVDRSGPTPKETVVTPLDVRLSDLSLSTPMHLELDATAAGTAPTTVRIRGTLGPIGDPPFAADVALEQHLTVHGPAVDVADLTIWGRLRRTPAGGPVASVRVTAPELRAGGVTLSALDVSTVEADGVATFERLTFGLFGGTITGKGRVAHGGAAPAFSMETAVRAMDVSQALAARAPDRASRFSGRLDADCSIAGTGGDEATVRRSLTGAGHVVVHDGTLTGVNVAEDVLTGVTRVSGLVSLVPQRVRDRYPAIFATDDTRFDELRSDLHIGGERIVVDAVSVAARDYAIRGKGNVTFAQQVDLTATLVASAPLTADVVGALKEAQYLADDQGHIAIPFRLTGVLPNLRPKPDADFVGRVLQKVLVGEGLDHLLGGGKHDDPKHPDGKRADDGGKDLLKRSLDKLFGR